jgi:histidyl-tRNA synthetase
MEQPKGVRDFLPREKLVRNSIVRALKKVFELFGYVPLETPALESLRTLTAKEGAGLGSEAYKEIYKLTDQAGRKLGLRFDLTIPLARVIAENPQLPRPFKRYQIGRAWRDGPTKVGRYKEFWSCDFDIVGSPSMLADAEVLAIFTRVFSKLGLSVIIKVNNRKLINGVLKFAGLPKSKWLDAIMSIDKLEKIGRDGVLKDARERGIDEDYMIKAIDMLEQENITKLAKFLDNQEAKEGLQEIKELLTYARALGARNIKFVPSLARGLAYYTGPVFEVFLKSGKFKSSLAAGGRFDNLIGAVKGTKQTIPATGAGMGLDTIYDALLIEKKIKLRETVTQLYIIPIQATKEALAIAKQFREAGINTDIDLIGRSISKNLSFCNSQKIPYVAFVGQKELKAKKIKLRDMKSGREQLLTIRQAISKLK